MGCHFSSAIAGLVQCGGLSWGTYDLEPLVLFETSILKYFEDVKNSVFPIAACRDRVLQ